MTSSDSLAPFLKKLNAIAASKDIDEMLHVIAALEFCVKRIWQNSRHAFCNEVTNDVLKILGTLPCAHVVSSYLLTTECRKKIYKCVGCKEAIIR